MSSFGEIGQMISFCRADCEQKTYCEKCRFKDLPNCQDYKIAQKLIEFGYIPEDLEKKRFLSFFRTFELIDNIVEICEIPKETVYMRLALKNCGVDYKELSDEEMKKIYEEKCSGWGFNGY